MVDFRRASLLLWTVRIFLFLLAFMAMGELSLLLAMPSGFASGVFLPMGISLGAVLIWGTPMLWGVFLGSFFLNFVASLGTSQEPSLHHVLLGIQIAIGNSLASLAGAQLIRHYIGFPDKLTDERKIFAFFLLGGPVATTLSSACGALGLYLHGIIHFKQIVFSWWTWWVGDTIGVLIAAPLMCVLFAKPRHFWRGRFYTLGVPLIISSVLVIGIFVLANNNEQKKLDASFKQQADLIANSVESSLMSVGYSLATLRGLFIASDQVTRDEFSAYVKHVIPGIKGVAGFAWNQYLRHPERVEFEKEMQAQGQDNFYVKEKIPAGGYQVAANRDDYIVIGFIEPGRENHMLLGINVAIDPFRFPVLERARDTGSLSMTRPVALLQNVNYTRGVIVYYPVYARVHNFATAVERQQTLKGFATAIVRLDELIPSAIETFSNHNVELHIADVTDMADPTIFFSNISTPASAHARALSVVKEFSFGGRRLSVNVIPTENFLLEHRSLQSWFVLVGGLLFCGLLGGFLLMITGRTQHIRDLVEQRTKELAAILEQAVESILVVDEHGKIIKANPAAMQLFGYQFGNLQGVEFGKLVPALNTVFPTDGESLKTITWRESTGVRSDQKELPIELSMSLVELQDRKFFTVIIHDATAKRRVEKLKNEFISTVSHELRTPLTSIKGAIGIALSGGLGELEARIKDLLIIANNNVDRLTRLVNDILDIDKLEFGSVQLNKKRLAIYPLVQQSIAQNQGYAARYGVEIEMDEADDAVQTAHSDVDSDRFLQVMSNLLSNAIKYSHLGGQVLVSLTANERELIISVIDKGQGIPASFRDHIFRKFAQADSSDTRRRNGTGLGLSISKSIVEKHGGRIGYHSVEGEGTTFFFTLPIAEADHQQL